MLINFIADSCGNIVRGGFRLQIRGSQEGGADTGRVSARGGSTNQAVYTTRDEG